MAETTTQGGEAQHHPVGVYLKVWGWLFVLSVCSYIVDITTFDPDWVWIQWTLITLLAIVKATLIVQYFMHLKWERLSLVYAVVTPIALVLLGAVFFVAEGGYIAGVRQLLGGG